VALDPATMEVVGGGIKEQTERVLANLGAVLDAAGSSFGQVLKTTVFLRDMNDFAAMNEVYARTFGAHRPARSTVAAAGLPKNVLVEIDVIAVRTPA
jgi:2-iminobutanoate/2-iminopropanoate deaminase